MKNHADHRLSDCRGKPQSLFEKMESSKKAAAGSAIERESKGDNP